MKTAPPLGARSAMLIGLAAATLGCSDGKARIEGIVTLDGTPLGGDNIRATVIMEPIAGGPTGYGSVDQQGRYAVFTGSVKGVEPGEYSVSVLGKRTEPNADPNQPPRSVPVTPPKYAVAKTSGLTVTAVAGSQEYDIDLSTGPLSKGQPEGPAGRP